MRIVLGSLVLVFAVISYDDGYARWWYLSLAIGLSVFLLQFTRFSLLRTYALWFGLFVILQSIVSLFFFDDAFRTLVPNLSYQRDAGEETPGITGVHQITTDALGFRTTPSIDYNDSSALRIFAIGGSTTEQILLDDRKTFTFLLQQSLRDATHGPVEVVNTGVSGLRANNHVATLRRVAALHPDMAVILLGVNDWNRHILLQHPEDIPESVARGWQGGWQYGIRLRNTLLGRVLVRLQRALQKPQSDAGPMTARPGGLNVGHKDSLARPKKRTFRPGNVSQEYSAHLEQLFNLCREVDVPCLFVTQPHAYAESAPPEMRREFWMTPPYADYTLDLGSMQHVADLYNDYLIRQARERGFEVCDIASEMSPTFDSFYDDVHFNTPGAERVAQLLLPCVVSVLESRQR